MSNSPWPHQFTKDGKEVQIGEEKFMDNTYRPIMAQPMVCVHCHRKYTQGVDAYPTDLCPARNDKRELKRIKNVTG